MSTVVYNIKQITNPKQNKVIFGITGYVLSDEPTKVGCGLPSLPTEIGFVSKGDVEYTQYNDNKRKLKHFIVGADVYSTDDSFTARIATLIQGIEFTDVDTTKIVFVTDNAAYGTLYKNYIERWDEYLNKLTAGINNGIENLANVDLNKVIALHDRLISAVSRNGIEVIFLVKREFENKVNYGIRLAITMAYWGNGLSIGIPLSKSDYLPQEETLDIPNVITDYPRVYFNSILDTMEVGSNRYYLTRISTDEENLLGCRINDISYCYLETKEPIDIIDNLIADYRSLNHFTDLHISRIDINALKSKGQRYFTENKLYRVKDNRKGTVPMGHMHGVVLLDPNDAIVANDLVPTGLSLVIARYFKEIINIKNTIKDNIVPEGKLLEVISVKDVFFDSVDKKDKTVYTLKKDYPNGIKSVNLIIDSNYLDRNVSLPMFFGYDCFSRNALARLAAELVDFSIVLYEREAGDYRYGTLIETESLTAMIATCHANKLYLFSENI